MLAKGSLQLARGLSGAWDDHEFNQTGQLIGQAPFWQLRDVVCANQIKQLRLRKSGSVIADSVNGVGNTAAFDFLLIDFVAALSGQREPEEAAKCRVRPSRAGV